MKTAQNLFDKQTSKQFKNIEIDTIVYERNDDGLLLECSVDTKEGKVQRNLEISFNQWEFLLAHLKDSFLANRLEKMVSDMVDTVDWIAELPLKSLLGRPAQLKKLNTSAQYHVLRA